jgi:hypothetical protein
MVAELERLLRLPPARSQLLPQFLPRLLYLLRAQSTDPLRISRSTTRLDLDFRVHLLPRLLLDPHLKAKHQIQGRMEYYHYRMHPEIK